MSDPLDPAALARFVVERIEVGVFTVDASMKIVQFNRFMESHTGATAASVLGRDLFECFPDLPKKWLAQKIRGVILLKNFEVFTCAESERAYKSIIQKDFR